MRSLAAIAFALLTAVALPAQAGTAITRADFVEAYVACNNGAWTDNRQKILVVKEPTRSDLMRGLDSPAVRGFVGENLYYDGVLAAFQPRGRATVGWALATKAFADRGDIERRFQRRDVANALLRAHNLTGVGTLSDRQAGAIATELSLGSAHGGRNAITPIAAGAHLEAPLGAATARAMLSKIGTHFEVGLHGRPSPGVACPVNVYSALFRGKT